MLLDKEGFPQEDEIVIASITKVNPNSVFATLDHYGGKTGLIHISEISPGRIRNIRDYVVEGKKGILKVLKVDRQKGHIDLSLRRVTEIQKRKFQDQIKQELKAEKLLEAFAKDNKLDKKTLKELVDEIGEKYEYIHEFFLDIVDNELKAETVIKDAKTAKLLQANVIEIISPTQVEIKREFKISVFIAGGADIIKEILTKEVKDNVKITYKGAGAYNLLVTAIDYKAAEKLVATATKNVQEAVEENQGIFSIA